MPLVEPAQDGEAEQPTERQPKAPPLFHVRPDDNDRQTAMFKNSHLRLLMKLTGLELLGPASEETPESAWVIPATVSADTLKDAIHYINQAEFSPPTFEEGVLAEHQLKRKAAPRKKAAFDDDEEGEPDDELLFPIGGPTTRKVIDEERPKKTRKRRRRSSALDEPDPKELEERRRKRRENDYEKARKIKSEEFVKDGDDEFDSEEDEAFFAPATTATILSDDEDTEEDATLAFIRKALSSAVEEDEIEGTLANGGDGDGRKRRRVSVESTSQDGDGDEEMGGMDKDAEKGEDDEDAAPVVGRRSRVRGPFIVDSDDDDE
ncbi:hypothetical protein NM208_g12801 [Fusarium decemcellulare]|uniref:Uncharacterized protein n=1 Tax=Fusarium decemcellulare TaxID=57161 RepID=A0ACC1RNK7_9HYPO|nr:hypothetical protein NM208_g12801 [Fusarium decemcellulare]